MIDYVRLNTDIALPEDVFCWSRWRKATIPQTGITVWYHRFRGVWVRYYPETYRMTINGKLLMLLEDSEVLNIDDVYERDIPQFIDDLNTYLNALFKTPWLQIATFHVTRIDYCFNVKTPYVSEYIHFLNNAFRRMNRGNRVNYTMEKHLDGSVYIKTKSDYEHNERRNYVLNFYDKTDRLNALIRQGHRVSEHDLEYARGVLRLEVQCGFQFIKWICKTLNIKPVFGAMLDYRIAYLSELEVYQRVFHCDDKQDYYTYKAAKKRIPDRKAAAKVLLKASQGHKITDNQSAYGRKIVQNAGVFPFCFLPRDVAIDMLENPLRLIQRKLVEIGVWVDDTILPIKSH